MSASCKSTKTGGNAGRAYEAPSISEHGPGLANRLARESHRTTVTEILSPIRILSPTFRDNTSIGSPRSKELPCAPNHCLPEHDGNEHNATLPIITP